MKRFPIALILLLSACGGLAEEQPRSIPRDVQVTADVVTATGRWVTEQKLDVPLMPRVNSVEIVCTRETLSCTESLAVLVTSEDEPKIKGKLLLSISDTYRIDSWTETQIRAKAEKPVADVTLEIDLARKELKRTHQETSARGNATADPAFIVTWSLQ